MIKKILSSLILSAFLTSPAISQTQMLPAITETISFSDLINHENYSPKTKSLIENALILANQHLTYLYGSADPKNKGMDCSGTIYYLLTQQQIKSVPRQSDQIYKWVWQEGSFHAVNGTDFSSFEFEKLKPGDLLFWSGTYEIKRDLPITHVMLYIGKNRQQQPLMVGASDGRSYQGKKMWGVSVFDFKLPEANSTSRFLGYGCIPTYNCK